MAEALRQGLLDDLDPAALAALVSVLHLRAPQPGCRRRRRGSRRAEVRERWHAIEALARELQRRRGARPGCPLTRLPDPTFVAVAHAWAAGEGFDEVLEDEELSGGDFVRNMKQLIDLLRQVAEVGAGGRHPPAARGGRRRAVPRASVARLRASVGRRDDEPRGRDRDDREGRAWGAPGAAAGRRRAWCAPTPRPAPWSSRPAGPGEPIPALGLLGGDLCRTVGGHGRRGPAARGADAMILPVDLGAVLLDGRLHWFVAHLVARAAWWRGRVVAAMNAQFLGRWDVAPRAHPNDGRLDVLDADRRWPSATGSRRGGAWPPGTHVPHPGIAESRGSRRCSSTLDRPTAGLARRRRRWATARTASAIRVEPDAARPCVV